ncbi:metallophosphoesterase family protein [Fodinibius sp.]|uniref:metallophosphoesterase family protein n=1 Tax=Fodinibius sp. TaxID=1872440 RepID=UPI002ACD2AD8|nr:metallophosphoesterase family protein [Fodinibius sp.]MDZ7660359.1 metallophosphoesterase family protein [Fodinibius sp.]
MNVQSFAYITDTHLDESYLSKIGVDTRENWLRILESVSKKGLQDIVFGGDIGKADTHNWFFDTLQSFSFRIILGNHDNYQNVSEHLDLSLPQHNNDEFYYSQESDDNILLFLDSSSNSISKHQLKWVKSKLNRKRRVIVFIHHPVLPVETFVDTAAPLQNRDELETIFRKVGQEVTIFCGHYHMDHTQKKGSVTQIITPASSYQMEQSLNKVINTDTFGYRIIKLNNNSIDTELVMFD